MAQNVSDPKALEAAASGLAAALARYSPSQHDFRRLVRAEIEESPARTWALMALDRAAAAHHGFSVWSDLEQSTYSGPKFIRSVVTEAIELAKVPKL